MANNLKHTPEGLVEAFKEHLVYEIRMLREAYALLGRPGLEQNLGSLLIEAFCVHARTLIDFFSEPSETPGQARSDYMGAKHFCEKFELWSEGKPSNRLLDQLNKQISHLTYDRTINPVDKIGPVERMNLKNILEKEIAKFAKSLKPDYAKHWPFREEPKLEVEPSPFGASSSSSSILLRIPSE